jgi:hypothetical protein
MKDQITVEVKNVYGNETVYPVCGTAKFFAQLAGTKSLTRDMLRAIKAMGFEITVQAPAVQL